MAHGRGHPSQPHPQRAGTAIPDRPARRRARGWGVRGVWGRAAGAGGAGAWRVAGGTAGRLGMVAEAVVPPRAARVAGGAMVATGRRTAPEPLSPLTRSPPENLSTEDLR